MEKIPEYLGKTGRSIETTYRWKVKMRAFWHFFRDTHGLSGLYSVSFLLFFKNSSG